MSVHPIEYRYFYPEMKKLWTEENKLETWLKVEATLVKVHAKLGTIPQSAADEIVKKANLNFVKLDRVKEIEEEIQHDLMAMVNALTEVCDGEAKNYVHLGATSYDIEDTALALQLRDSVKIIENDLNELKGGLLNLASIHKETICIGRTHGQHALPTTYGMKFALWATEMKRHMERLDDVKKRILVGKMSGAVGTSASHGEKAEEINKLVMQELNLGQVLITTQVIQRDRHAELLMDLALIAATLDKIAKEIRNLQRTEIAEVMEPVKAKQVGSSAMPHKRNPHKSERICGLARIIKSFALTSLENVSLEHERDLTNSAPERIIYPETFILLDYMLRQMSQIMNGLEFNYGNIKRNLEMTKGLIMTEHVMNGLVKRGMGRQEAHEFLRNCSSEVIKTGKSLKEVLFEKGISQYFTEEELDWYLEPKNYIGNSIGLVENVIRTLGKS